MIENHFTAYSVLTAMTGAVFGGLFMTFLFVRADKKKSKLMGTLSDFANRRSSEYGEPAAEFRHDSWSRLVSSVEGMADTLKRRILALENEKSTTAAILENMSEGVIALDAHRRILAVNPAAMRTLGLFRVETVTGRPFIEVVRDPKMDAWIAEAIRTKSSMISEFELFHAVETVIRASISGFGKAVHGVSAVLVFHDVTELRRLENVRRDFVANVSHELKTPLTSIRGFIETLAGGAYKKPDEAKPFLDMMGEDVERLSRLIEDLLDLARIESQKVPLNRKALHLEEQIEKALVGFKARLAEKRIRVHEDFPSEALPPVLADSERLHQIVSNLLDNAIKFSHAGGEITIRAFRQGTDVLCSVEDTGIGIPEEAVPRVFERFFRVDKARSTGASGTGLGLSIVKHLVESHGGRVECRSTPGEGSIFSFTLPTVL